MKTPLAFLSFLTVAAGAVAAEPAPLALWTFNEGAGTHAANTGSSGDADLFLLAPGGDAPASFSADRAGPSGKPGDFAFDLTSATGMGATTPNSNGPVGVVWSNPSGLAALSGLSSFTLSGWFKPSVPVNAAARIVVSPTLTLMGGVQDRVVLQVNGVAAAEQSEPSFDQVDSWMFFAIAYDGTRDAGNVRYYVGSTADKSLAAAGVTTLAAGPLKPFSGQFLVGNNTVKGVTTRPFKGLIDHLAIHGATKGPDGALSFEKIEALRASALR